MRTRIGLVKWKHWIYYENMMQLSDAKLANPQQNSVYFKESVYSEAAAKKGMFKSNGQGKVGKYSWKTKWRNKLDFMQRNFTSGRKSERNVWYDPSNTQSQPHV